MKTSLVMCIFLMSSIPLAFAFQPSTAEGLYESIFTCPDDAGKLTDIEKSCDQPGERERLIEFVQRYKKIKLKKSNAPFEMKERDRKKQCLVRSIVALIDKPNIEKKAAVWIDEIPIAYEWEGDSERPLAEAQSAEKTLEDPVWLDLQPFIHLFVAHRYRCAAEAMAAAGDREGSERAMDKYRNRLLSAKKSNDAIFAWIADAMEAREYVYIIPQAAGSTTVDRYSTDSSTEEIIAGIRTHYQEINKQIESKSLYISSIDLNSGRLSYPGVGIFDLKYDFYFDIEDGTHWRLKKARLSGQRSAVNFYAEFLYDERGRVCFIFIEDKTTSEKERAYFQDDRPIRYMMNEKISDSPDENQIARIKEYQRSAKEIADLFESVQRAPSPL